MTEEEFFNGVSKPVNEELANIFLKLKYMEQSGKGISTIISKYGKNVFHFGSSFIECILPFNIVDKEKYYQLIGKNVANDVANDNELIFNAIKNNKYITRSELAILIKKSVKTVERIIKSDTRIIRIGSPRTGHWEIKE